MAKNGNSKAKRGGRKSKSESVTGAKESAVVVRKAGELDLVPIDLNEDDFTLHFKAMRSAKERVETANSLYRSCAKAAKQVSTDLLDAVKLALRFEGMDPHDIRKAMEIAGFVLKQTNAPVQLTVHDALMGDVLEVAYRRGHEAGQNGQTMASPYPKSSDLDGAYTNGWRDGTGGNLGLSPEQVQAALATSDSPTQSALN